jgi:thiamine-phosphate pyrophosphorylase
MSNPVRPRLFLIVPDDVSADENAGRVQQALAGGDVACVLFQKRHSPTRPAYLQHLQTSVPICRAHDVAALVHNEAELVQATGADGLHMDGDEPTTSQLVDRLHPQSIIGRGNIDTRHAAMEAGEAGVDYIFFGSLDGAEATAADNLDLSRWWSGLFQTPCVALAPSAASDVDMVFKTGSEFIGLQHGIWSAADGPGNAVARANAVIDAALERRR